jgi:Baseplate wedge protein gp25
MDPSESNQAYTSFLGTGWSFPPEFVLETGEVLMTSDEEDIQASLKILLGTSFGERFLNPKYGLDMHELLFDPHRRTAHQSAFARDRHIGTVRGQGGNYPGIRSSGHQLSLQPRLSILHYGCERGQSKRKNPGITWLKRRSFSA